MLFKRSSGVLVHPTSFPSDYGIGDLGKNAFEFIDFLYESNQKLWQILPLCPTGFGDSPYQSFCAFAGNVYLISPDALIEENYLSLAEIGNVDDLSCEFVDYGKIINFKQKIFQKAFINFKKNKTKEQNSKYLVFTKENSHWLNDFALFMAIKDFYIKERKNTFKSPEFIEYKKLNEKILTENQINDFFYGAMWNTWEKNIASHDKKAVEFWNRKLSDEIEYFKFLQFEFYRQWSLIKNYANKKDIQIIGDIPIFVSLDSSDVWANSKLYQLDKNYYPTSVAGVPPDYFSATGQLWGNPLYDWNEHKKTNYDWWIKRIKSVLETVDIVRIDHFRGFVGYWSIPYGNATAENGKWLKGPCHDLFNAIEKKLGKLPIIAEDLGVMTSEVENLRDYFNFPGMKVLQFAFGDGEKNNYLPHNFLNTNSVIYTGTHDNNTTFGWYKSASQKEIDHLRRYLNIDGSNISWDLIRLSFSSISVFAIVPIQDLLNLDENFRMNTPGIASENWQFRFKKEMLTKDISNGLLYLTKMFNR